jgi:hypothetical protein
VHRFAFAFTTPYRIAGLPFGITPSTAWVEVDERELRARFGPWRLRTPLANVGGTQLTGGFSFVRTAGPAHLSLADRGVTFATNGDRAVCVSFVEPVRALDPLGLIRHPGATLTVAEPEVLAAALS